jgi:formamidopyrimidine-DNA glycosylase
MPELPEVETTRSGIEPHIKSRQVTEVLVRQPRLRWPVPADLPAHVQGQVVESVTRRGKYLLLNFGNGTVLLHLGMSGSLRMVAASQPAGKHDHIDFIFDSGTCLRLKDPRRFGAVLWAGPDPLNHQLLINLGPEPLSDSFTGEYLRKRAIGRAVAVKNFIMNGRTVVGVGNIYANEALFAAGISPTRSAGKISLKRYLLLAAAIKRILAEAISRGGTTLKDFVGGDGEPGYFKQQLNVYGRAGQGCVNCGAILKEKRLLDRSTVYCGFCQR